MPSPLLQLRIPQDLADWLESKFQGRGEVAEYVRQLLTAEQMKEAAAPLVPVDEITIFERCSKEGHVEGPNGGCRCGYLWSEGTPLTQHGIPSNAEFEAYKAKPKARRKKGSVGNPSVDLRDALQATVEATRKPKTCQHSNTIRKLGQPFCTDCGEFV